MKIFFRIIYEGSLFMSFFFFFFSSRRRHTRCLSDWSSDVCSSDLNAANQMEYQRVINEAESLTSSLLHTYESSTKLANELRQHLNRVSLLLREAENEYHDNAFAPFWRSEERRVGKACSFVWR